MEILPFLSRKENSREDIILNQAQIVLYIIKENRNSIKNIYKQILEYKYPNGRSLKPDAIKIVIDCLKEKELSEEIINIVEDIFIRVSVGRVKYCKLDVEGDKAIGIASGQLVHKSSKNLKDKNVQKHLRTIILKSGNSENIEGEEFIEYLASQLSKILMGDNAPKVRLYKGKFRIGSTFIDNFKTFEDDKNSLEEFKKDPREFGHYFVANAVLANIDAQNLGNAGIRIAKDGTRHISAIDFGHGLSYIPLSRINNRNQEWNEINKFKYLITIVPSPIATEAMFHGADFVCDLNNAIANINERKIRKVIQISIKNLKELYGKRILKKKNIKKIIEERIIGIEIKKLDEILLENKIVEQITKIKSQLQHMLSEEAELAIIEAIKKNDKLTIIRLYKQNPEFFIDFVSKFNSLESLNIEASVLTFSTEIDDNLTNQIDVTNIVTNSIEETVDPISTHSIIEVIPEIEEKRHKIPNEDDFLNTKLIIENIKAVDNDIFNINSLTLNEIKNLVRYVKIYASSIDKLSSFRFTEQGFVRIIKDVSVVLDQITNEELYYLANAMLNDQNINKILSAEEQEQSRYTHLQRKYIYQCLNSLLKERDFHLSRMDIKKFKENFKEQLFNIVSKKGVFFSYDSSLNTDEQNRELLNKFLKNIKFLRAKDNDTKTVVEIIFKLKNLEDQELKYLAFQIMSNSMINPLKLKGFSALDILLNKKLIFEAKKNDILNIIFFMLLHREAISQENLKAVEESVIAMDCDVQLLDMYDNGISIQSTKNIEIIINDEIFQSVLKNIDLLYCKGGFKTTLTRKTEIVLTDISIEELKVLTCIIMTNPEVNTLPFSHEFCYSKIEGGVAIDSKEQDIFRMLNSVFSIHDYMLLQKNLSLMIIEKINSLHRILNKFQIYIENNFSLSALQQLQEQVFSVISYIKSSMKNLLDNPIFYKDDNYKVLYTLQESKDSHSVTEILKNVLPLAQIYNFQIDLQDIDLSLVDFALLQSSYITQAKFTFEQEQVLPEGVIQQKYQKLLETALQGTLEDLKILIEHPESSHYYANVKAESKIANMLLMNLCMLKLENENENIKIKEKIAYLINSGRASIIYLIENEWKTSFAPGLEIFFEEIMLMISSRNSKISINTSTELMNFDKKKLFFIAVSLGGKEALNIIEMLIKNDEIDINQTSVLEDVFGLNALEIACLEGNPDIAAYLLSIKKPGSQAVLYDVNRQVNDKTLIERVLKRFDFVSRKQSLEKENYIQILNLLKEHQANLNLEVIAILQDSQFIKDDVNKEELLFLSCKYGWIEQVKKLLKDDEVNINKRLKNPMDPFSPFSRPLDIACDIGDEELLTFILNHPKFTGIDESLGGSFYIPPTNIGPLIVSKGYEVAYLPPALLIAIEKEHWNIVQKLIEKGASPNTLYEGKPIFLHVFDKYSSASINKINALDEINALYGIFKKSDFTIPDITGRLLKDSDGRAINFVGSANIKNILTEVLQASAFEVEKVAEEKIDSEKYKHDNKYTHPINLDTENISNFNSVSFGLSRIAKILSERPLAGRLLKVIPYAQNQYLQLTDEANSSSVSAVKVHNRMVISSAEDNHAESAESSTTTYFVKEVIYDNLLLQHPKLLVSVYKYGGIKALNRLIELGKEKDIAAQILEAIEEQGVETVLSTLFEKQEEIKNQEVLVNESNAELSDSLLTMIDKVKEVIGEGEANSLGGFAQYVMNALGHNSLTSSAQHMIKIMSDYIENLEYLLDASIFGEDGVVPYDSYITAILLRLENLFEYAESGQRMMSYYTPRPPYFDPDDFGGGFGSGYREDNQNDKEINPYIESIPVYSSNNTNIVFLGGNSTSLESDR